MHAGADIPWADLDTLFLDAGNTLVSIDFARLGAELEPLGLVVDADTLCRSEAAARPVLDGRLSARGSTEGHGGFERYLQTLLEQIPDLGDERALELAARLAPRLREPGLAHRLWSRVLPGVPEALRRFRHAGLRLVVVSNSDGSVERGLVDLGLREVLDAVVDSHHVGFEKPDPRIFRHALAAASAEPARTLHVGDLVYADVKGARNAGLHPLLLDPYGDWEGVEGADCLRLPDLLALADRLETERTGS
jgi:putative hydrolase of the HAD superfamily